MRGTRLRVAVTGLAATYPFGGVFWDYVQYLAGFHRLGHDVLYIEDTGKWCYDPTRETFTEGGDHNADLLSRHLAAHDPALAGRWFFRDSTGRTFGRPWPEVAAFCREADLFINISDSSCLREEYLEADTVAFIDSDPMYTQAWLLDVNPDTGEPRWGGRIRHHHVFFTFAENIGQPDCRIPSCGIDWIPTRQPVILGSFGPAAVPLSSRRQVLTTVASWEPKEEGPTVDGVRYRGKSAEFERFLELPARSPLPLEIALSGAAPVERLRAAGWVIRDGFEVSHDPWVYRDYLAHSLGEWSIAKNAYVAGRTGWFSCRTACYLALGVPAVVQDTGFSRVLPTGEGLLAFTTLEEAAEVIDRLASSPARHAAAARALAEEYFDSDKVLGRLIEQALNRDR
jgi:hypothetical protein